MLGEAGGSEVEQWVHQARREATWHALRQLAAVDGVGRVVVASPRSEQQACPSEPTLAHVEWDLDVPGSRFQFGERLASVVTRFNLERVLYIGGGSTPLLSTPQLAGVVRDLGQAQGRWAVANNLYSSDWFGLTEARRLEQFAERLPRDNMLGWVMQEEAGYAVRAQPPAAATRLDIDTPTDLLALRWHPDTPAAVRDRVEQALPQQAQSRWLAAGRVLATPATQVALLGRVAASVWQFAEQHTRCWFRVYSEERGMTASGRKQAGVVHSLIAEHVAVVGEERFFGALARLADAVYFDTRVYLAHHGTRPSAAERFASDLGLLELVHDEHLRRLTAASLECGVPVVLGGHGVVAGGMYALIETLQAGAMP